MSSSAPAPTRRELYDREVDFTVQPKHLIKILTYNIWDKREYWQERIEHVVHLIKDNSPDVCCLIDVNEDCYNYVQRELEKAYVVFQAFVQEGDHAGIVLLCKRDTVEIIELPYYYDFTSGKGQIVGVDLKLISNGEQLTVLCTKLDDHQDNDHIRSDQFAMILQAIKKIHNCIVVGDFNIFRDNEDIHNKIRASRLNDAWTKMGCPNRVKYTFDGKRNRITQDRTQMRASRIYYIGSRLQIKGLGFVGTSTISESLRITPSCHYGLLGTFQCLT
jgi:exonuclease III